MYISRLISILLLLVATASTTSISAQDKADSRMNRQEWFKQMRVYKHDFLIKDLGLWQEQKEKFSPLYDAMSESIMKAQRDSRQHEHKINHSKTQVNDLEYEKATEAVIETRAKEVQIAKEYYAKFKGILTPAQIYRLTQSERRFTREVMKQHSRMKQKHSND